jgi:hypothetical protein
MATSLEQTQADEQRLTLIATITPLVEQRQALAQVIAELEAQKAELTEQITVEMVREGILKVEVGDYNVSYADVKRTTLSKEKLVELGVPTTTIKAAEKESSFSRLDVRAKGGKG